MNPRPASVLFACNFNRVRSPMAEALMQALYGDAVFVDSCGLRAGEGIDPLADQVMREAGLDLSRHAAKRFDDLRPDAFDVVIAFTPESRDLAAALSRGSAVEIEYWPLPDPTLTEGAREAALEGYRQVRDELKARLVARFGAPLAGPAPGS